jgi:predicted transcriptional regulator
MQKVSIYVDAAIWKKLKAISRETMNPSAALIRKALEGVVKDYAKKK